MLCHHVWQMAMLHLVCPQTEVGRNCEVVIDGTSDETFDVHVKCPLFALVVSVMLSLGVGRQALHSPSPSSISSAAMRTPEEGLHFRPSSSHCGCALAMPHRALQGVSVVSIQELATPTRKTRSHSHQVDIRECETSKQGLLSSALLASVWTQNAKNVLATFVQVQEKVQDNLTVTSHFLAQLSWSVCRLGVRRQACGNCRERSSSQVSRS